MSAWISVKDRLPDNGAIVLLACKDNADGVTDFKTGKYYAHTLPPSWTVEKFYEVTHWMPIEPPEGEK